jgi:peroxin-5
VWFALGIKQQDSEREAKAIDDLRRSVELDPTYMPSWLALGISHTNDSNRQGAYTAIREWVERHERYESLPQKLHSLSTSASFTLMERYEQLISCLITMARSDITGNVDADIQVALAVLLNSIEVTFTWSASF